LALSSAFDWPETPRIEKPRYSRVKLCVTAKADSAQNDGRLTADASVPKRAHFRIPMSIRLVHSAG